MRAFQRRIQQCPTALRRGEVALLIQQLHLYDLCTKREAAQPVTTKENPRADQAAAGEVARAKSEGGGRVYL